MGLSDMITPDIEAAPWVIEEVKKLEAELAALRQQQGEPVAVVRDNPDDYGTIIESTGAVNLQPGTKLYREAAPRVPEGWQKTPLEIIYEAISATVLEHPDEWLSVTATFRQNTSGIGVIDELCIRIAAPELKE